MSVVAGRLLTRATLFSGSEVLGCFSYEVVSNVYIHPSLAVPNSIQYPASGIEHPESRSTLYDLNSIVHIPTRSRRQAMEWSLVLASQGIECVIEHSEEPPTWRLTVASSDSQRAISTIRQYHAENRGWGWRRQMVRAGIVFDWTALGWALLLAIFFWLNENRVDLQTPGATDSAAVARGEWWRLFTAVWLHADAAHLAANSTIGFVLLGLAMGHYGTGLGLLASYIAGAAGNCLAATISAHPHHSLGASGMVMGALGLLIVGGFPVFGAASSVSSPARRSPAQRDEGGSSDSLPTPIEVVMPGSPSPHSAGNAVTRRIKLIFPIVLAGSMLFILLGLSPDPRTDLMAHLGGFLGGIILGPIFRLLANLKEKPVVNAVAGLLFALLLILPWWLALAHSRTQP